MLVTHRSCIINLSGFEQNNTHHLPGFRVLRLAVENALDEHVREVVVALYDQFLGFFQESWNGRGRF